MTATLIHMLDFRAVLTISVLIWLGSLTVLVFQVQGWWWLGLLPMLYECWLGWHLLHRGTCAPSLTVVPPGGLPAVRMAVLIAARNERAALPKTVEAVLADLGPEDEAIVIDDGSTDDGAAVLAETFGLVWSGDEARAGTGGAGHRLRVLRRPVNRGKASALNDGLATTGADVVVTLDADTLIRPGALGAMRQAFTADADLVTACGVVVPTTAERGWAARIFTWFQRLEYRRSYAWRLGWSADRCLALVPGAFAAFRRTSLQAVGGFAVDSLVEDYEVMFRLHAAARERMRTAVVADAVAWTEAPVTPSAFLRQRRRWFAGFIATMIRHRRMVGDPSLGRFGRWHLRLKTIDIGLPLVTLSVWVALVIHALGGHVSGLAIAVVVAGKVLHDLILHGAADRLTGTRLGPAGSAGRGTTLLLVTDPFIFQPMRQLGAALGCLAALRAQAGWVPQRSATGRDRPLTGGAGGVTPRGNPGPSPTTGAAQGVGDPSLRTTLEPGWPSR